MDEIQDRNPGHEFDALITANKKLSVNTHLKKTQIIINGKQAFNVLRYFALQRIQQCREELKVASAKDRKQTTIIHARNCKKSKKKLDDLYKQKLQTFTEEKTNFYQKSMSRNSI